MAEILYKKYILNMSYIEIAEELELSESRVKAIHNVALKEYERLTNE